MDGHGWNDFNHRTVQLGVIWVSDNSNKHNRDTNSNNNNND